MRSFLIPALLVAVAAVLFFVPGFGAVASIAVLGFAPVVTLIMKDAANLETLRPDRTKVAYFLFTAIFPIMYSSILFMTMLEPELIETIEPVFMAFWLVLLLVSFVVYYILACFMQRVLSEKRYVTMAIFIVLYAILAFVQTFSIEISYVVILLQP